MHLNMTKRYTYGGREAMHLNLTEGYIVRETMHLNLTEDIDSKTQCT